jgi:lysocardiolipin and lysophospholipid acyltransferase
MQGRSPDVHMHWRRFAVADIPLGSPQAFEAWLLARWREKDALLDAFQATGHFPSALDDSAQAPIRTRLRLRHWAELWRVFSVWLGPVAWVFGARSRY